MDSLNAELCAKCPIRGECVGPIHHVDRKKIEIKEEVPVMFSRVNRRFSLVIVVDANRRESEIFKTVDTTNIINRFEECSSPDIIWPSLIPFKKPGPGITRVCGALGVGPICPKLQEQIERAEIIDERRPSSNPSNRLEQIILDLGING